MNKEEKIDLKKKLEVDTSTLPFDFIAVNEPIEDVMKHDVYRGIIEATRKNYRAQFEEACVEPINISCPYKTEVLEGSYGYETSDWLVIYGIEILEGEGDLTLYSTCGREQEIAKIHSSGSGNFISPKSIIVPELTTFVLTPEHVKYRLVGEGNNNPKMDLYYERTYRLAKKVHVEDNDGS